MTHLLMNEPPLQVLPSLAKAIGLNEAIVLQYIHQRLATTPAEKRHFYQGAYWLHGSLREWHEDLPFWSMNTIRRLLDALSAPSFGPEKKPLLVTDRVGERGRPYWYAIDYDVLNSILSHRGG